MLGASPSSRLTSNTGDHCHLRHCPSPQTCLVGLPPESKPVSCLIERGSPRGASQGDVGVGHCPIRTALGSREAREFSL